MCTAIPIAGCWSAKRAPMKLRASGQEVPSIHRCFTDHPRAWHVTSKKPRAWPRAIAAAAGLRSAASERRLHARTVPAQPIRLCPFSPRAQVCHQRGSAAQQHQRSAEGKRANRLGRHDWHAAGGSLE